MNTTERRRWEQQGEILGHTSQRLPERERWGPAGGTPRCLEPWWGCVCANLGEVSDLTNWKGNLSSNRPLTNSGRGCFVTSRASFLGSKGAVNRHRHWICNFLSPVCVQAPSALFNAWLTLSNKHLFWNHAKFHVTGWGLLRHILCVGTRRGGYGGETQTLPRVHGAPRLVKR